MLETIGVKCGARRFPMKAWIANTPLPQPTNLTSPAGIDVPEKDISVQKLGPNEIKTKKGPTAMAGGQRAAHAQDGDDGQDD